MAKAPAPYRGHLIIHTGDHKTGTTSIQEGLARGDVTLAEGKIAYPLDAGQFNHNYMLRRVRANRLLPGRPVVLEVPMTRFARRTQRRNADVTVLSAERLEFIRPEKLTEALDTYLPTGGGTLSVITYLRPQTDRIVSGLAEKIKIGWVSSNPWHLLEHKTRNRMRFAPRLENWRKVFGDSFIVRPAIRSEIAGGDSLQDLLTTALGPDRATVTRALKSNTSLGVEDLMRLHVIHSALPQLDRWQHHDLGWILAEHIGTLRAPGGPNTPLRAHKALAERVRRRFRRDAQAVDAGFFGGLPFLSDALDAAVDKALPERLPLTPSAWLSPDEIAGLRDRAPEFAAMVSGPGWRAVWHKERMERIHGRGAPDPAQSA